MPAIARTGSILALLLFATTLAADDPTVPIEERGPVDVPSLVIAAPAPIPVDRGPQEQAAVEAVKNIDLEVFELLPANDRDECAEVVWTARLAAELSQPERDAIRKCIFDTQAARARVANVFDNARARGAAAESPQSLRLEGRSVRFGDTPIPVKSITKALGEDAESCIDAAGRPIADCVQREAIQPMRRFLALQQDAAPLTKLAVANSRIAAAQSPAPPPGPGAAATVASFATSWEAIVINAIADQMVVQLKGAAATRLLGVFGNSICRDDGPEGNVKSFFPETCNLLTNSQLDTSSSRAISQIPGEFQRALRNDTLASLPGFLTAAGAKDPMLAALGPVLVQFLAEPDAPLTKIESAAAKAYCATGDSQGTRACLTYALIEAVGAACSGADCTVTDPLRTTFDAWKAKFDPQSAKTVDILVGDVQNLRTLYTSSKRDIAARVTFFFAVLDTFGKYNNGDRGAFVLLRKWDQKSYRWATTALTVYRVAQDFRRGYEPIDLAKTISAQKLCVAPASATVYDAGCAVQFTALTITAMRKSLDDSASDELATRVEKLKAALKQMVTDLQNNDPLQKWADQQHLKDRVEALADLAGPDLIAALKDIKAAKLLADKPARTKEEDEQLDALYNRIIDGIFNTWATITSKTVPEGDAERAKRLITNTGVCWRAAREKNYGTLANALYSVALDSGIGKPFPPVVERYRLLFTNMVAAQDPTAFKTAVESYLSHTAAPESKFESKSGLWLTGLPGVGVRGAGSDGNFGIFAPVGLDFMLNPGLLGGKGRLAIYLQLLDLGNLVKLKYDGNEASSDDVKFRDVAAAGLYLRYPWRSGFSVGAGGSYVPVIETNGNNNDERKLKLRLNAFVAYDLSWFRLFGVGQPRN